ncbi:MAG TPA: hypothetical protein DCS55_03320, partial [Acidimicrobiaceae bacterium]|nr:hypothetical protein [Acidimicrobiaceae bacterium]
MGGFELGDGGDGQSVTVAGPDGARSAGEVDGLWRVVATVNDGERQSAEGTANLRFDGDRVRGDDGCNNRMEARLEDGAIVGPSVRTQVACPNEAAVKEAELFWTALGQPVDVQDAELWLVDGDGDGLVFARVDEGREVPAAAEPTVTVAVDGFGPVEATVSPLTVSEQGWLEHTVTLTNTGTETVHLQDFRTGTMLGDRQVAVATDGCGHGSSSDEPVMMGCNRDYRPVTIEAGGTHTFTVTLWRDLAGMNPVGEGTYEWSWSVDRRDTPFDDPDQTGTTGTLILTYKDLGSTSGSTGSDQAGTDAAGGVDGPVLYGP